MASRSFRRQCWATVTDEVLGTNTDTVTGTIPGTDMDSLPDHDPVTVTNPDTGTGTDPAVPSRLGRQTLRLPLSRHELFHGRFDAEMAGPLARKWYLEGAMIVSATRSGRGAVFGLRVLEEDRSLWFRPEWRWVTVWLPGEVWPAAIPLSASFWGSNPELRSPRIRTFLLREGLESWPAGEPPHFELAPLGGGAFRLHWVEPRLREPLLPIGP